MKDRWPSRILLGLAWATWLAPTVILAHTLAAVIQFYSPMPYGDQWDLIDGWGGVLRHGLTLGYLFSQHNEHRIFFPRLVFLADLQWFGGWDLLNRFAIALLQAIGATLFIWVTRPWKRPATIVAVALSAALLASLAQWHNFAWGFQVEFVGVFALGGWAIYAFCVSADRAQPPRWGLLTAAMALLIIVSFSLANGFFAGIVMVAVGLLTRRRSIPIIVAGVATVVIAAIYLNGFKPVAGHSPLMLALQRPWQAVLYTATYLGNIWSGSSVDRAIDLGMVGMAGVLAMGASIAFGAVRDAARASLFGLALFVAMTAASTSIGRLSFGIDQSLASRYATPCAYFWAAQACFWALSLERRFNRAGEWALVGACLGGFAVLGFVQGHARVDLRGFAAGNRLAESALLSGDDDHAALLLTYYDEAKLRRLSHLLQARRLGIFAEHRVYPVGAEFHPGPVADPHDCDGFFDSVVAPTAGAAWRATGWSWDRARGGPFSEIVIVDTAGLVRGVGLSGEARPDVATALHRRAAADAGWVASVDSGAEGPLVAYALRRDGRSCVIGSNRQLALLTPPPADFLQRAVATPTACRGAFDSITPTSHGDGRARGWAWDSQDARTIQKVVLADESDVVVGAAAGGYQRLDVSAANPQIHSDYTGWVGSLSRPVTGAAVAYGVIDDRRVCKLGQASWPS